MSDFGAIIYFRKKDKTAFTENEFNSIQIMNNRISKQLEWSNSLGEPYLFKTIKSNLFNKEECFEIRLLLSQYGGDSLDFEWHKEVDEIDLERITSQLEMLISAEYLLEAKFEWL